MSFADFVKSGKKPVIMQVVPSLNLGGVEQGVIDVNAAIVKAGGVSIVVSNGGVREHEIAKEGGTFIKLPVHSKNPFTMLANIKRLRKIIKENNVDVAHVCSRAPAWSLKPAVKGTNAILMTSCHSAHHIDFPGKRLYNSSVLQGELVMVSSYYLGELVQKEYGIDLKKIRPVPRGMAVEKYNPASVSQERVATLVKQWRVPEESLVLLLPARISRTKGHMFLVDAIEKLGRKDVFCVFAGNVDGNENYAAELEKYIEGKNLGAQVRLVGPCKDMPAAYRLARVILMPSSLPEGFGRVAIEAQAMGRPVIATNHGGAKETIVHGKTGWLVDYGDVDALVKALETVINMSEAELEAFAKVAREHALENFSNEKMCAGVLSIYAELMELKQKRNA